jgi:hypothetical protein
MNPQDITAEPTLILSATPRKRMTNVQRLTHLMEFSNSGPLMQAYILNALMNYSEDMLDEDEETTPDHSLIAAGTWRRCANECLTTLRDHLKSHE